MSNIQQLFAFRNLSRSVEAVKTGIPDRLPPAFSAITEKVIGNETTFNNWFGMRKIVRRVEYGAPPRHYAKNPMAQKSLVMPSFSGYIDVEQDLILRLRQPDDLMAQEKGKEFIVRAAKDFKQRFDNNRLAHQVQVLARGGLWYTADGTLLPSSSGAVVSDDFGVPAINKGQANGIISTAWSDPAANILLQLETLKRRQIQTTGRPLKHVFYGLNIPGYIYTNSSFKYYFQFNPTYYQALAQDQYTIPNGFQNLTWHKMSDCFYEKEDGTTQQLWDEDAITLTPEIDSDVYTMFEGSYLIPTDMGVTRGDVFDTSKSAVVYGRQGWSIQDISSGVIQLKLIFADLFKPQWKLPNDILILDVTP